MLLHQLDLYFRMKDCDRVRKAIREYPTLLDNPAILQRLRSRYPMIQKTEGDYDSSRHNYMLLPEGIDIFGTAIPVQFKHRQ